MGIHVKKMSKEGNYSCFIPVCGVQKVVPDKPREGRGTEGTRDLRKRPQDRISDQIILYDSPEAVI